AGDAVALGTGQHRRQTRRLRGGEPVGIAPEPGARRGLRAVDAIAELDDVGIDLEDPPLGPEQLDQQRVPGLDALAQPARRRALPLPEEQVLGQLLADGAAAAQPPTAFIAL